MNSTPDRDAVPAFGGKACLGLCVAPACGLLLFAVSLVLNDARFATGVSGEVQDLLVITLTFGLTATYFLVGLLGLPTIYLLHRMSALNLWTVNAASLAWLVLLILSLRLTSVSPAPDLLAFDEISSLLAALGLAAPFVLLGATLFFWIATKEGSFRFRLSSLLFLVAIVGASLSVTSVICEAMQARIVASVRHPGGARLLVTQEWRGEPFDTSIFYDSGDGNWCWYYYEHEDWYWGDADGEIAGDEIRVSSGRRSVIINTLTGECRRTRPDGKQWTTAKSTRVDRSPPVSPEAIDRSLQPGG